MRDLEITIEQHALDETVQCGICGETFETHQASAILTENNVEGLPSHPIIADEELGYILVCPTCLNSGPTEAGRRAFAFAIKLCEKSVALGILVARIQNIHPENWATAKELAAAEVKGE